MYIKKSYAGVCVSTVPWTEKQEFSGTVQGENVMLKRILLLERGTGFLVSASTPYEDGSFSIFSPIRDDSSLMAICTDESGVFNADVFDKVSLCNKEFNQSDYAPTSMLTATYKYTVSDILGMNTSTTLFSYTEDFEVVYEDFTSAIDRAVYKNNDLYYEDSSGNRLEIDLPTDIIQNTRFGIHDLSDFFSTTPVVTPAMLDPLGDGSCTSLFTLANPSDIVDHHGNRPSPLVSSHNPDVNIFTHGILANGGYHDFPITLDNVNGWTLSWKAVPTEVNDGNNKPFWLGNTAGTSYALFSKYQQSDNDDWYLYVNGGSVGSPNSTFSGHIWYQITYAGSANGNQIYIYLNGTQKLGYTTALYDIDRLLLGHKAYILNLQIFNRALSLAECNTVRAGFNYYDFLLKDSGMDLSYSKFEENSINIQNGTSYEDSTYVYMPLRHNLDVFFSESSDNTVIQATGLTLWKDHIEISEPLFVGASLGASDANHGNEDSLDISVSFKPNTVGDCLIWKSGDATNGLAFGILGGEIGFWATNASAVTSITLTYTINTSSSFTVRLTNNSLVELYDAGSGELLGSASGTLSIGTVTEQEIVGSANASSPIPGIVDEKYDGKLFEIASYDQGTHTHLFPTKANNLKATDITGSVHYDVVSISDSIDISDSSFPYYVKLPTVYAGIDTSFVLSYDDENDVPTTNSGAVPALPHGAGQDIIDLRADGEADSLITYSILDESASSFTARSVIFDIEDNWGDVDNVGLRSIEFYKNDQLIELTPDLFTAYSTSTNLAYNILDLFITDRSKHGVAEGTSWLSNAVTTNQRIVLVMNDIFAFDKLVINNYHDSGINTSKGAKSITIMTSLQVMSKAVYKQLPSDRLLLTEYQLQQHPDIDASSDVFMPVDLSGKNNAINSLEGYIACYCAFAGTNSEDNYDVNNNSTDFWQQNFADTESLGAFNTAKTTGTTADTGVIAEPHTFTHFNLGWVLRMYVAKSCWSSDIATMDVEFLDDADTCVVALRAYKTGSFTTGLSYGPNLSDLPNSAAGTGTYPRVNGYLSFTDTALIWNPSGTTNYLNAFQFDCNMTAVTKIRISNIRAYTSNSACSAFSYLRIEPNYVNHFGEEDTYTDCVGHWTFDDYDSSYFLDSIGNNHLSFGAYSNSDLTAGVFNDALYNTTVSLVASANFLNPVPFKSVSFWAKHVGSFNKMIPQILGNADNDTTFSLGRYQGSSAKVIRIGSQEFASQVTDTDWHHYVLVEADDPNHHQLYVDGVLDANTVQSDWNGMFHSIGPRVISDAYPVAGIDNLQVYSTVLTEEEVLELYNKTDETPIASANSPRVPVTTHHWTFEDMNGSIVNDSIGDKPLTSNNMTIGSGWVGFGASCGSNPSNNLDVGEDLYFKTICLRYKRNNASLVSNIITNSSGNTNIAISPAELNYIYSYDNDNKNRTDIVLNDTDWHFIVIREGSDPNHHDIFVDGVWASSEIQTSFNGAFRYFGRANFSSSQEAGSFDNIQVFDSVLTDSQVIELFSKVDETALYKSVSNTTASPYVDARSIVLDIHSNHGGAYTGIRQIEFYDEFDTVISFDDSSIDAYAWGNDGSFHYPKFSVLSSTSKIGDNKDNQWQASGTSGRFSIVFDKVYKISKIVINNSHDDGGVTEYGVNSVTITASTREITSTTYNDTVPDSIELVTNSLPEHPADNSVSDYVVPITYPITDYEQYILAKSIIIDVTDNYGRHYTGIRSVEFFYKGVRIDLLDSDFTAYSTEIVNTSYYPQYTFDTAKSKTGGSRDNQWLAGYNDPDNQRLIAVFNDVIKFDQIVINNSHDSGDPTENPAGAKNVMIKASTEIVTDITYNETVPAKFDVFSGILPVHSDANVVEDYDVPINLPELVDPSENVSYYTNVKSVVIDITNNHGSTDYHGLRMIEFFDEDYNPIILGVDSFDSYATSTASDNFASYGPDNVFLSTNPKIGGEAGNHWVSDYVTTPQRIVIVFTVPINLRKMVINNYHNSGTQLTRGIKDIKVSVSEDIVSDYSYNGVISNPSLIFDGTVPMHSGVNSADDFELDLLPPSSGFTVFDSKILCVIPSGKLLSDTDNLYVPIVVSDTIGSSALEVPDLLTSLKQDIKAQKSSTSIKYSDFGYDNDAMALYNHVHAKFADDPYGGLICDGTVDSVITLTGLPSYRLRTNYAVSFFVRRFNSGNQGVISGSDANQFHVELANTYMYTRSGGMSETGTISSSYYTQWMHIGIRFSHSNNYYYYYVNGEYVGSDSAGNEYTIPDLVTMYLGRSQYSNTYYLDGKIRDFALLKGSYTSDDMKRIYKHGFYPKNLDYTTMSIDTDVDDISNLIGAITDIKLKVSTDSIPFVSFDNKTIYHWNSEKLVEAVSSDDLVHSQGNSNLHYKVDGQWIPFLPEYTSSDDVTQCISKFSSTIKVNSFTKTVIFDIANSRRSNYIGVRQIDFYDDQGALIELTSSDYYAYATSAENNFAVANAFDTSKPKEYWTDSTNNCWRCYQSDNIKDKRIAIVFNTARKLSKIVVTNYFYNDAKDTNIGIKDAKVYALDYSVIDNVYGSSVSGITPIFDGVINEYTAHSEQDLGVSMPAIDDTAVYSCADVNLTELDKFTDKAKFYISTKENQVIVDPVCFNDKVIQASDWYDLDALGQISTSKITWEYLREVSRVDSLSPTVYVTFDEATYTECTNGQEIPGVTPGMDVTGLQIRFKVVYDRDCINKNDNSYKINLNVEIDN